MFEAFDQRTRLHPFPAVAAYKVAPRSCSTISSINRESIPTPDQTHRNFPESLSACAHCFTFLRPRHHFSPREKPLNRVLSNTMLSARTRAKPFLGEFGLDATSKANRAAGDTVVSVWGLISTSSESETPENVMPLPYRSSGTNDESVIGSVDSRKLVAKEHFAPGGKYRCKR